MITDYKAISGWFDYEDLYDLVVKHLTKKLSRKINIVEIGAWLGKSSFYLVGKHSMKAHIFIIDTWRGTPNEMDSFHAIASERDIFTEFMRNMRLHYGKFTPIRCESVRAAEIFENRSIDFVFIDGDHTYEAVKADIETWLPKLTNHGIIAGHDYSQSFPGVIKAVKEKFGDETIVRIGRCWLYEKI